MNKVNLNDIIDIISGGTPKTTIEEYWRDGTIGWLSVNDFNNDNRYVYDSEKKITELGVEKSNTKYLNRGDIIISARGTVGALAQIGKPMCFNQSCFGIRGKEGVVDTDFLYYSLKNYVRNIIKRSQGSVFNTINLASFELMELEIPESIETQKQIAKVLSDIDAKIEVNNKINQELESLAKTIYDYWFVQFEFPTSEAQAQRIGNLSIIGKPYKSSGGKMVYNEELKREIPEGWEFKKLDQVIDTIIDHRGKTPKKLGSDWESNGEGIIALSAKIVKDGKLKNLEKANRVSKNLFDKWMPKKLIDGDVLLTSEAPAGECYFIHGFTDYCLSQRLFAVRVNNSIIKPSFFYFDISRGYSHAQIFQGLSGSTVFGIRQDVLRKINVLIPEYGLQNKFDCNVLPYLQRIKIIEKENQKLAALRDWLLPMLMNGQVTVEKQLGMVAEENSKYGEG